MQLTIFALLLAAVVHAAPHVAGTPKADYEKPRKHDAGILMHKGDGSQPKISELCDSFCMRKDWGCPDGWEKKWNKKKECDICCMPAGSIEL